MQIVIHHNPDCGTSRNVLAMIRASGETPIVVEYLKTGWTRPQLQALFAAANLTPKQALRVSKSPAEGLGLTAGDVTDQALLDAMLEHPILVNRPIVACRNGVRLCRPSEDVLPLLDKPLPADFLKEDGMPPAT
ncbi:MAG: arsenate reductase [Paracoccaceae bacterium]|jgi:arsenate reductase